MRPRYETTGEMVDLLAQAEDPSRRGDLRSSTQLVVERLILLIATGVLRQGDALPGERELAAGLSVSRDTLRRAIRQLADRGILEVAQGARTRIADCEVDHLVPTGRSIGEINRYPMEDMREARALIEPQLAEAAARRIAPAGLTALAASIAAQRAVRDDPVRFLIADRDFHQLLYRAGGNAVLADTAIGLYGYMMGARRQAVSEPGAIAQSIAEHEAILAALAAGDPAAARAAFEVHLARIHDTTDALVASGRAVGPSPPSSERQTP